MTKKTETITLCKQQSELTEHKCQYRTLLEKCAELLIDLQTEYAALHYSIYQDDEFDNDNDDDIFQSLYEDAEDTINKLKALKILKARL